VPLSLLHPQVLAGAHTLAPAHSPAPGPSLLRSVAMPIRVDLGGNRLRHFGCSRAEAPQQIDRRRYDASLRYCNVRVSNL
jgi:hypothetical protein